MFNNKHLLILAMLSIITALSTAPIGCVQEQQSDIAIEIFPICTDDAEQSEPVISGNIVVWQDKRNGVNSIYGYDLIEKTEFLIRENIGNTVYNIDHGPDIGGDIVVWQERSEEGDYDIWRYDLETKTVLPVCTDPDHQIFPRVGGNYIFWLDKYEYTELVVYNISTGETLVPFDEFGPSSYNVSGNTLVWGTGSRIFVYNLESTEQFTMTVGGPQRSLDINGNMVAWIDKSPTSSLWTYWRAGDIVVCDLTKGHVIRLPETWAGVSTPAVSGEFVVWADDRNDSWDIYGYDLSNEIEFPICTEEGDQIQVSMDGNTVVWVDDNHGNGDIYGVRITRSPD